MELRFTGLVYPLNTLAPVTVAEDSAVVGVLETTKVGGFVLLSMLTTFVPGKKLPVPVLTFTTIPVSNPVTLATVIVVPMLGEVVVDVYSGRFSARIST